MATLGVLASGDHGGAVLRHGAAANCTLGDKPQLEPSPSVLATSHNVIQLRLVSTPG
jgi:hypothetical protein